MRRLFLSALALLCFLPAFAGTKVFTPDTTHSVIGFKAATLLFKVEGRFDRYQVDIQGDPEALGSVKIRVAIDAASVDTQNETRDNHLRTPDFFDVKRFPAIVFTSSKAWRENGKVMVAGTLEMHGVKKELTLAFDPAFGKNGAGVDTWSYEASLWIKRSDFGIGADSIAAKLSLKDPVELNLMLVGFFHDAK
jgi:polyisoprenoid-binding protein YceI